MKLQFEPFSVNGKSEMKTTIWAADDDGTPIEGAESGAEWSVNMSEEKDRLYLIQRVRKECLVTEDEARKHVRDLLRAMQQARRQAQQNDASNQPDADDSPAPVQQGPAQQLPTILISGRYVREVIDDSWDVLLASSDPPRYYRMGDTLVSLERDDAGAHTQVIRREGLAARLDRLGNYDRKTREGDQIPAHPSRTMAEEMLAVLPAALPVLRAISGTPVLARDGQCLLESGYYHDLGLYLDLHGVAIPPVPERPSPGDIAEARRRLEKELLGDFPWAEEADRANALTSIMDPILRPNFDGPVPLRLAEAPDGGTGKGLYVEVVGLLTTGGAPSLMAEGRSDDEWRKRITAVLARSPTLVVIDNLTRPLDSGPLMMALTARMWEDRLLGYNKNVRLPVSCTWLATGNNPVLGGEMPRRTVRIRMDARVARPGERTGPDPDNPDKKWRHPDLAGWTRQNRGWLLWAVLVLAKAWHAKGRPAGNVTMGSYESWARVMGGVFDVAGIPGFLENRDAIYTDSSDISPWEALLAACATEFGDKTVGSNQIYELAKEKGLLPELRAGREDQGARVLIGRELSRLRDRHIGEWVIRDAGKTPGGTRAYRFEASRKIILAGAQDSKSSPASPATSTIFAGDAGDGSAGDDAPLDHPRQHPRQGFEHGAAGNPRSSAGDAGDDFESSARNECTCPRPWNRPPHIGSGYSPCSTCGQRCWCPTCGGCRNCVGFNSPQEPGEATVPDPTEEDDDLLDQLPF